MNKAILLALAAAATSGISIFLNGVAVKHADPFAYTTLKNLGALVVLATAAIALRQASEFKTLSRKQLVMLVLIGVIGGSVPFLLFFWGLKLGGPAVSSFIFRSLFIFAGAFAYVILKEKPETKHAIAGTAILAANALLLTGKLEFGLGQALVLAATVLWALEYTISRKMLADLKPSTVMTSRMLFGSIALLAFLTTTGNAGQLLAISQEAAAWLAVTSLSLALFLFLWYNTIKAMPLLQATVILSLGGVVTAALEAAVLHKSFAFAETTAFTLTIIGVALAATTAKTITQTPQRWW